MTLAMLFSLLLLAGWLASKLVSRCRLPPILGTLATGIIVGYFFSQDLPDSLVDTSQLIKNFSLIVILLTASMGIHYEALKKAGLSAIFMMFIPCLVEGSALTVIFYYWFDFSWSIAALTAFMLSAVSPAVLIPAMVELNKTGHGVKQAIPTILLTGSSVDNVMAITLFSICLHLAMNVSNVDIGASLLLIPIDLIIGIIPGVLAGLLLILLFKYINLRTIERLLIALTVSIILVELGHLVDSAALLGVMIIGFLIRFFSDKQANELVRHLAIIWFFAQILLFTLIGLSVNIDTIANAGMKGVLAIFMGLLFRSLGVLMATQLSHLSLKERLFCVVAYWPKATVQAALGGVALASGLPHGQLILALAVMSIVLTAPLGLIAINFFSTRWLKKEPFSEVKKV